jgi:release factor glutamine methyltransferase
MSVERTANRRLLLNPAFDESPEPIETRRTAVYFANPHGKRISEYEKVLLYAQPNPDWIPGGLGLRGWTGKFAGGRGCWENYFTEARCSDWFAFRDPGARWERGWPWRELGAGRFARGTAPAVPDDAVGRAPSPCHGLIASVPMPNDLEALAALLSGAGFVAPEEEADELLACAAGDIGLLDSLVGRRLTGEPLGWITGRVSFCGLEMCVYPGVYVPRWQSEPLARRAVERLPTNGAAIDVCTGAGAMAKTLITYRPGARVVASDVDERAVACAKANGVEVYLGDLFAPLPRTLEGRVHVVVGVVPYVPTPALPLLQRDTFAFESPLSYDGGRDGTDILRRVLTDSRGFLRRGGALLLELGGEQADALGDDLARLGYVDVSVLVDEDGALRGIEATLGEQPS